MRTKEVRAVQDGISTTNTYVVLTRNGRQGMHMALRPYITRVNEFVVLMGGRLRIAFDFQEQGRVATPRKYDSMDVDEKIKALKEEFPGFQWETGDARRCSTTAGILVAAGDGDLEAFKKQWEEIDFVGALLDELSAKAKQTLHGLKGEKKAQETMYDALTKKFEKSFPYAFYGEGVLDEGLLGEISGLVNTSQRGYARTLKAFTKKVNRFQDKAA